MRSVQQKIHHHVLLLWYKLYHLVPHWYHYKEVRVLVHRKVFSPYLTVSTKLFADYLDKLDLEGKAVLELGCGNGLLSMLAAKKKAHVTASDINETALHCLKKSAERSGLTIEMVYSDLFDQFEKRTFDYILINPPYYPKNPSTMWEKAWYCGEKFEYFERLFQQLRTQLPSTCTCLMILSENGKIEQVKSIAGKYAVRIELVEVLVSKYEKNCLFRLLV